MEAISEWMSAVQFLLFLWIAAFVLNCVSLLLGWGLHRLAGVEIERFQIFVGPILIRRKWGDVEFALGVFPGGYLKYRSLDDYQNKPRWVRALLPLTMAGSSALVSVCLLGWTGFAHHFISALPQFVQAACHPWSGAIPLVRQLHDIASVSPFDAVGVVAAKVALLHALPAGASPMTLSLLAALNVNTQNRLHEIYIVAGALPLLWMSGAWLFATATYLWTIWG